MALRSLAAAVLVCTLSASPAWADVILLKNGNRVDGKISSDEREKDGGVLTVEVDGGRMYFRASEVASVTKGEVEAAKTEGDDDDDIDSILTTPATFKDFVEVKLAKGKWSYYGGGNYYGRVSSESNEQTLVLEIPEVGKLRLARSGIASIDAIETEAAAVPTGLAPMDTPTEVKTTHVLYLKNGNRMNGDVLPTAENEPVKLKVGEMGIVLVKRSEIDRIAEESGVIALPADDATDEGSLPEMDPSDTAPAPASDLEALKEELKAEILRELLDALIGERLGAIRPATPESAGAEIADEAITDIQTAVRELGRQRTRNRVRAERQLKEIGPAALAYLRPAIHHPFELTRRAAQRIVLEIGDRRGAPLAIDGLSDPDRFVRVTAYEALQELLPEVVVAYSPDAPRAEQLRDQTEYWALWDALLLEDAKNEAMRQLTQR